MSRGDRSRIRLAAGIVCALAFGVYLWNANEWVPRWLKAPDEQTPRKAAPLGALPVAETFAIDDLELNPGTRLQKVFLLGWILPPPAWREPGAGATSCEIVFQSRRAEYRVAPEAQERKDIRDIFGVENPAAATGFRARFSPVAMKKGYYRMGVVVRAGTNDLAVAWASHVFIQDRHGFRIR